MIVNDDEDGENFDLVDFEGEKRVRCTIHRMDIVRRFAFQRRIGQDSFATDSNAN